MPLSSSIAKADLTIEPGLSKHTYVSSVFILAEMARKMGILSPQLIMVTYLMQGIVRWYQWSCYSIDLWRWLLFTAYSPVSFFKCKLLKCPVSTKQWPRTLRKPRPASNSTCGLTEFLGMRLELLMYTMR